jgi:hypothetical protein
MALLDRGLLRLVARTLCVVVAAGCTGLDHSNEKSDGGDDHGEGRDAGMQDDHARAGDNVFVAGSTEGGLDGHVSAGQADLFVVKYDSSGNRL